MAARYTGRHVRQASQARHGAWLKKERSRGRQPSAHLLPVLAAIVVAGLLVGGASTTIALSPANGVSALPTIDPADVPPPDPRVGAELPPRTAARAPLVPAGAAGSKTVIETGSCNASHYSPRRTASGDPFDPAGHTAAHETLPFGSLVRVISVSTGASVVVRVNDRGPYYYGRCLNLSVGAFASIANPADGVAAVRFEVLATA